MAWKFRRKSKQPAAETEAPGVNGFFRGTEKLVSGWLLDVKDPHRKHDVEVFVGGKRIGVAKADRYDALVQSHHGGDGKFAFAIYYDGDLSRGPAEASAVDTETGFVLRSKQPLVKPSLRAGPPLQIDKLAIGNAVELRGRIGAYPWTKDLALELWAGGKRVVSSIPVSAVNEAEGLFSAKLQREALATVLAGKTEIALPGLKEAGLAVTLEKLPIRAAVSEHESGLRISLRGRFEQVGPIPVVLRLLGEGGAAVEHELTMTSRVALVPASAGYEGGEGSVEVLVAGAAVPTRFESPLLDDLQFRTLGHEDSRWTVSENATAEQGFFAFPPALADQHELSGHVGHVSRQSGDEPLIIKQRIDSLPPTKDNVSVAAFVRAGRKSKIVLRLRDDEGIIGESAKTTKSSDSWTLLGVDLGQCRDAVGEVVFEVEAAGRNVADLELAITNSTEPDGDAAETDGPNLIANPGFLEWPHGAGVIEHSGSGEICSGWRVRNRRSKAFTYTRALVEPSTGAIGVAVAAPEVASYLRIEGDFQVSDVADQPLVLQFGAGSPPGARQMLAQAGEATPQFSVIDRVYIIRRTRITSAESFTERDEVVATFARKVPIRRDVERFSYGSAAIEEADEPEVDDGEVVEVSCHLAFDFRHPTAVALFDVEVLGADAAGVSAESAPLKVEDRNIELQIETLETTAHWRGATPVRLASETGSKEQAPLKWSTGRSHEPVTVVIPVFNALPETLACLDSINGASTVPTLVRIIDDASDPTVREALHEYARTKPWIHVHSFAQNRGYTYAADYGIRQALTPWVVLLNSDTIVTRGWLEGMLDCARTDSRIGFVGPLSNAASYQSVPELYDASRKWKVNRLPPGVTPDDVAEIVRRVSLKAHPHVPLLNGFCTLMKRSVFEEIGGLNPTAFPVGYGEENDLCLRATKAGVKLAVADDVYVYHVKSASFGNARREELTKSGNAALRKLHPDVDISALTAGFRETPALVAVRHGVAAELAKLHAPRDVEAGDAAAKATPAKPDRGKREPQLQRA